MNYGLSAQLAVGGLWFTWSTSKEYGNAYFVDVFANVIVPVHVIDDSLPKTRQRLAI
jgi:hypothetical protein